MTQFHKAIVASAVLTSLAVAITCVGNSLLRSSRAIESAAVLTPNPAVAYPKFPTVAASPERPPPLGIVTPMPGDPADSLLSEARLVVTNCENYWENELKKKHELVEKMRAEVDVAYQQWGAWQVSCWKDYNQRRILESRRVGANSKGPGAATVGESAGANRGIIVAGAPSKASDRTAKSRSGTNNQVEGVDEADMVKTDGRYVYLAMNRALHIIEAMNPRVLSVTKIDGNVREMLVEGDRAVVYSAVGQTSGRGTNHCTYGYDCVFAGDGTSTKISVFDISDRTSPKVVREILFSGSLMSARRIGTTVHTVTADAEPGWANYSVLPNDLDTCGIKGAALKAKFTALKAENEKKIMTSVSLPSVTEKGKETFLCDGLWQTPYSDGQAFSTLGSFDLDDNDTPVTTTTIRSRPGAVFASNNALYLSVVHKKNNTGKQWYSFYSSHDEVSEIHKFQIGESPLLTKYLGSGVVPGHVLNQFSMDEWYGYLRVATTRGQVPNPEVESVLSVLAESENGNLVRVGAIEKIAPGEDIRAVRFDGDRGYIVTFKKTDPLFVADLFDPADPKILGELKIPGFSTYIHPVDPEHLLSIGFDADDKGKFAYYDGMLLQLFDVRDPTEPKLIRKEKIGTRGSSSEAATDHLAFNYHAEKGLLAIPMTICEGGGKGNTRTDLTFSGLLVYHVSASKGFQRLGAISHESQMASCATSWSKAKSAVKRSVFLDELVYSIATDRAKVQKMGNFGVDIADLPLWP